MPAVKRNIPRVDDATSAISVDRVRQYGSAGVGARLRRLSERIDREARAVYAHVGVKFEQRWMAVLMLLVERSEATVGELAEAIGITQPSVSQTLRSLKTAKMISERPDQRDARRRIQCLTSKGLALVDRIQPVWAALIEAAKDLDREGIDLITPLDQVEESLDRKSLYERALGYMAHNDIPASRRSRNRGHQ
jgi:DNA-binding MarR family transcriptional regulator